MSLSTAVDVCTLRHVSYFHDSSTENQGDIYVSWGGGVILQFWGSGFNGSPVSNTIQLAAWIDGAYYTIEGTAMDGKYHLGISPVPHSRVIYPRGNPPYLIHYFIF